MKLLDFYKKFPNEKACEKYLHDIREKKGVACSRCGGTHQYWDKSRKCWRCARCGHQTTLTSGTVMHGSKLPLMYWFAAMHLMTATKKAISALEMQRQLGHKRYQPIWEMMHKLRSVMGTRDDEYKLKNMVELDEGFFTCNDERNDDTGRCVDRHRDLLGHKAFDASMEMFKRPSHQYALSRVLYPQELTDYVRRKQQGQAAASHYVECTSENANLTVGSVVDVKSSFLERVGSLSTDGIGEFIITEIEHTVSEDRYYSNRFKGIPSTVQTLPLPEVPMPVAESQTGVVVSNADPDGKGRVQVRMVWQTEGMRTDWLRVMTPDGGGSDDVRTNRGFVFIPEVGDHVLVGFRHGDPNRPYVMGSLFSGKTGRGGDEGNKCKSLTTRSGSSLKMDDSDGSVTLHDKGGVSMKFDGGGCSSFNAKKNSTITAGKSHAINAGTNASVNAGANYAANVGKGASCLNMDADGNIVLEGKAKITLKVGENTIVISADGIVTSTGTGDVKTTATAGSVTIESTSSEATLKGSTNTNVGGGDYTYITATDVEINQS